MKAARLLLAIVLVLLLPPPTLAADAPGPAPARTAFYVMSLGWHTGIVVPRAAVPPGAWPPGVAERDFAGCGFLELGWGDRRFYMAQNPSALGAISAALAFGPSVLHIVGYVGPPARVPWCKDLVTVPCTRAELDRLCRALGESFARDAAGRAPCLGPGLYGEKSGFYAARGRYWIGNTCNAWTLRTGRAGGLPVRVGPLGTLSAGAVVAQTRRAAARRDQPAAGRRFVLGVEAGAWHAGRLWRTAAGR